MLLFTDALGMIVLVVLQWRWTVAMWADPGKLLLPSYLLFI
jgi:hypothetical protein